MIACRRIVAKQRRRFILIHDQDVEVAVIVEVAEGATPAYVALIKGGLRAFREFVEGSVSPVTEGMRGPLRGYVGRTVFKLSNLP